MLTNHKVIKNFPEAHALIETYIKNPNSGFLGLNVELQAFLIKLHNQITTLFSQIGWLRQTGVIANYYTQRENKDIDEAVIPTQTDLLQEAIKTHEKTKKFTLDILTKVKEDLTKLKTNLPDYLDKMLQEIRLLIDNTFKLIESQKSLGEESFFDPLVILAQELGVAFIPSYQTLDPIKEYKNLGICYGHFRMWVNNVTSNPTPSIDLDRTTPYTFFHQSHFAKGPHSFSNKFAFVPSATYFDSVWAPNDLMAVELPSQIDKKVVFDKNKTIRGAVQEIIANVSSGHVYGIIIERFHVRINAMVPHAMGVRQFHNGDYEYFDPLHGTFFFQNAFQLERWLVHLVRHYSCNNVRKFAGSLQLTVMGPQSTNAVAIIPELNHSPLNYRLEMMSEEELSDKNTIECKSTDIGLEFRVIGFNKIEAKGTIPWDKFPIEIGQQKSAKAVVDHSELCLPVILDVLSEQGLTHAPPPPHERRSQRPNLVSFCGLELTRELEYRAYLLSLTNIKAEITEQKTLYQFLKRESVFDADKLKDSIDRESKQLKDCVIAKIDQEIKRLQDRLGNRSEKATRIKALRDLQKRVVNAELTQSLSFIVNQWLMSTMPDSHPVMTNRDRIIKNHTNVFINELEEKNEISPSYLNWMRAAMVVQLKQMIFDRSWVRLATSSGTIQSLKDTFSIFEMSELTLRELLIQVKEIASKSYRAGISSARQAESFLSRHAHCTISGLYYLFYQLRTIEPDNVYSIQFQIIKLQTFDENFLMKVTPALKPQSVSQLPPQLNAERKYTL